MQDQNFESGVWGIVHHGPRALIGRFAEPEDGTTTPAGIVPNIAQLPNCITLFDAMEIEFISLPARGPDGSVVFQHQTMLKPVGAATDTCTVHVLFDRIQFLSQMEKEDKEQYKKMYNAVLKDIATARAARSGIQIVSGIDGRHRNQT